MKLKLQLEKLLGASVKAIGPEGCIEKVICKGKGCWSRTIFQENFFLIDANETAFVGPKFDIITGCGCGPSMFINDDVVKNSSSTTTLNNSFPIRFSHNMTKASNNGNPKMDTLVINSDIPTLRSYDRLSCLNKPCRNGGNCLPSNLVEFR